MRENGVVRIARAAVAADGKHIHVKIIIRRKIVGQNNRRNFQAVHAISLKGGGERSIARGVGQRNVDEFAGRKRDFIRNVGAGRVVIGGGNERRRQRRINRVRFAGVVYVIAQRKIIQLGQI